MSERAIKLDAEFVRRQIGQLLFNHEELKDDEDLRADAIEGETDAHKVLDRIVAAIHGADAEDSGLGGRLKTLDARRQRARNRKTALRRTAQEIMDAAGMKKLVLTEATLSMKAVPPGVVITDETLLPDDCLRFPAPEPNKTAIKERLDRGEEVPGACFGNGGQSLAIRS